jgi:hypothetical protein
MIEKRDVEEKQPIEGRVFDGKDSIAVKEDSESTLKRDIKTYSKKQNDPLNAENQFVDSRSNKDTASVHVEKGNCKYNVIFEGKIIDGFEIKKTKGKLAKLLKITPDKADTLFSGKNIVLKRNTSLEIGEKALNRLQKIGAQSRLDRIDI